MQLSEKVSKEIKNYIMNLLGKDAFVVDMNGICLASADPNEIGAKIELPKDSFKASDAKNIKFNNKVQVLIPLEYQRETVALLILNEKMEKDTCQLIPMLRFLRLFGTGIKKSIERMELRF